MNSPYTLWAGALLRRQSLRIAGTAIGIAIAVALLATLAGFVAAAEATMTKRSVADVAVDWQVQLAPGANPQAAIDELNRAPGASKLVEAGYFDTPGFEATTGDTVQTTGPGKVLGLGPGYRDAFPAEIRDLVGQGQILLAQQTAANLHAAPGTTISIKRPGLPPVQVTVEAVVDLPLADSLFQAVGVPPGSAPQAPPDNVLLLPLDQWHALFDSVLSLAPDAVHLQLHATIPHNLPASPTNAYADVTGKERNYEQRMAGQALVGDNLAAQLDGARSDALYARVLFLFLGLPGAILAALLTLVLAGAAATRRRKDQALLRLRGASPGRVLGLAGVEAATIGIGGSLIGLGLAALAVHWTFGRWTFGNGAGATILWGGVAALVGVALAALAVLVPAWRDARQTTIVAARRTVGRAQGWWWERIGLDAILLVLAAIIYRQAARGGYQLVLVPEGVPKVSVSYTPFLAPLLLWAGAALLTMRLTRLLLMHDGRAVAPIIRPIGGRLAGLVGASLGRQRSRVATGLVLVVLAVAFAGSTAIFNATYRAQARVDAELTNGADVTVTGGASADLAGHLDTIAHLPGVEAVEPMQHRFAYVGTDLQDLYGVGPATLTRAAQLSDAYFLGGSAKDVMARLAATSDGVLVSPETVSDFQLQPGDTIRLRLQSATDQQYHVVPFHYVGIAREFPTAPSDSFLVANAAYIAQQTGSPTVETLLIRTSDSPATVADRVRTTLGATSGATVRGVDEARRVVDSGLTAISLRGLTRLELAFAVALAAAGSGLVLALGLEERRRTLAIASALGAKPRQLGAFVWSEAGLILGGGLVGGAALGWGIAHVLTKLLTQVFDPPPQEETIPWAYCTLVVVVTTAGVILAGEMLTRLGRRGVLETIRRL
jgi:putative ABC transport system permease protein